VPKLAIRVQPAARVDGLRVSANGLPRNEGTWDVFLPVDPGDIVVVATAPGRRESRVTVHVAEGQQQNVELLPLVALAPPPPAPLPVAPPTEHASLLRPVGVGVGLLGLAAIGVGSYFGVHAIGKWNDSNAACPGTTCSNPSGVSLASDAQGAARVADVTLAAGAVAVVAGFVLYLLGAPATVQVRGTTGELAFSF
jgi:hypothetical protein